MDRTLDEVTPDCAAKLGEETTTPAAGLCVCVRACVRACVRGSVRVCAWLVLHSQVLCWCFRCIDAVAIVVVLVSPVLTTFSWDRSCWERLLAWLRELRASETAALQGNLQRPAAAPLSRAGGEQEQEEEDAPLLQSEGSADAAAPSQSLPELTTGQVVQTADFWLFLFGAAWLVGGGQVLSVNINQMCESRGYGEPCKSS